MVHVSCGVSNVWGVDNEGMVYLRIGNGPPSQQFLNPAWVPVDGTPQTSGAKFRTVVTGPLDWMVSKSVQFIDECRKVIYPQ